MDRFLFSSPGFRLRIAHHVDFPGYTVEELLEIGKLMLARQNYRDAAIAAFGEHVG